MSRREPQRSFPVRYVDRPGHVGAQPRDKSPVMEVAIGWGKKFKKVYALIDTGADIVFIDRRLLEQTKCPRLSITTNVRSQHAEARHEMHQATLIFPGSTELRIAKVEVAAINIDYSASPYSAILGTSFLEMGCLVLEPESESHFTFHQRYFAQASDDGYRA